MTGEAAPSTELERRVRQHALLAEIGRRALSDTGLDTLFTEAKPGRGRVEEQFDLLVRVFGRVLQ